MITVQERTSASSGLSRIPQSKKFIVFLMALVLVGVLIGTLAFCNMSTGEISDLSFITQGFIKNRAAQTFFETLSASFTSAGFLVLLCFLLGFGAISQPAELLIPIFRGIGLGTSIAYIYTSYGTRGFFITLVIIVPHAVISSVAIVIAARESMRMSNLFTGYAFTSGRETEMRTNIKLYLLKFLVLFAIIGISSFLDSILTFLFAGILL